MDYKVLYRKYRPTNFDELVGQDHIKNILKNSIINNKIAHAYMFTGPRGTGKTSTAKIFARSLNCFNSKDGIPCGECDSCLDFNTSPDIIEMDAASNNSVDDIREIVDNVSIAPSFSKYKIYIIDEVHMLSSSAWNAFLKTLEEPPSNVVFILATTDIQKVPITVLSRCQRFDFTRIDRELIKNNLISICEKENILYEENAIMEISYLSDGCMRDALSILDQLSKVSDNISIDVLKNNYGTVTADDIDILYTAIIKNDIDLLINNLNSIKSTGIDIKILIDKMLDNFIDKAINMKKKNVSSNVFNQLKKIIASLNNLLGRLTYNSNGYLLLELELLSFINDENNNISSREVDQIISREIIRVDKKLDVNDFIKSDKTEEYYNVTDEFVDIRVNNAFVDCNKELKVKFLEDWKKFLDELESKNKKDFINIVKKSVPQVVGETNITLMTSTGSIKILANSKLYDLENSFNNIFQTKYKFIFISKEDWNKVLKGYDSSKKYDKISEDEFINENSNDSVKLAEDIFGDNIEIE